MNFKTDPKEGKWFRINILSYECGKNKMFVIS